jgi:hypothetical protein
MANTYKILGQQAPAATTEQDLYTVPSSTSAVISSIVICNRGTTATTFRVSITPTNTATTSKDYLYYDVTLAGNDTFIATVGITLATTNIVRVYAGNANLSFNLFGTELS